MEQIKRRWKAQDKRKNRPKEKILDSQGSSGEMDESEYSPAEGETEGWERREGL